MFCFEGIFQHPLSNEFESSFVGCSWTVLKMFFTYISNLLQRRETGDLVEKFFWLQLARLGYPGFTQCLRLAFQKQRVARFWSTKIWKICLGFCCLPAFLHLHQRPWNDIDKHCTRRELFGLRLPMATLEHSTKPTGSRYRTKRLSQTGKSPVATSWNLRVALCCKRYKIDYGEQVRNCFFFFFLFFLLLLLFCFFHKRYLKTSFHNNYIYTYLYLICRKKVT